MLSKLAAPVGRGGFVTLLAAAREAFLFVSSSEAVFSEDAALVRA